MILNSRLTTQALTYIVIGISSISTVTAQPPASLFHELTQRYTLTKVDPDGTVNQAGTVVSVGHYLLRANPIYGDRYQPNSYKKGRVSQPTFMKPSRDNVRLADSLGYLGFGQKVYITNIEISDADVVFKLQACGASIAQPQAGAIYRAALSFQFQKGFTSPGNLNQIENTIREVLTVVQPAETPVGSTLQAPQTAGVPIPPAPQGEQQGLDIVHVGQTVEEVKGLLGQPDKIENASGKVIYSYTGLKVTFINGKVSGVQ